MMLPTDCLFIRRAGGVFRLILRDAAGGEICKGEFPGRLAAVRGLHEYYRQHVVRVEVFGFNRDVDGLELEKSPE